MKHSVRILIGLVAGTMAAATQETVKIDFRNYIPGVLDAPVFDADGVTRLVPTGVWTREFFAQVPIGKTSAEGAFMPAGGPSPFQTGTNAGYWEPQQVVLADVALGERIWVQVRVSEWIATGPLEHTMGLRGKSRILSFMGTNSVMTLVGLGSFNLQPEPFCHERREGQIVLKWEHLGASRYDLEATDNLAATNSWSAVFTWSGMEGFGTTLSVTNLIVGPQRFYRLKRWR